MLDILYKSTLAPRQVIEPYKYFAEDYEYIYKDNESITHYDEKNRVIYYNKNIINPYQASFHGTDIKFDDIFKKTVLNDCDDTDVDILKLNNLSNNKPIIIGGCGRSGTTLLLSILAAHSNIFGVDTELYSFYPVFRLKKLINFLNDNQFSKDKTWCEKTPKNIINFNKIYEKFEGNINLIHIVRDGRDVITSEHPYHLNQYWVTKERWVLDVKAGLDCKNCMLVKYEDLVSNPEQTLREICDYCKLEFEPQLLNFQNFTNVTKNVAWENNKAVKIHTNQIKKWKKDKYWPIIRDFVNTDECVSLLKTLDYE